MGHKAELYLVVSSTLSGFHSLFYAHWTCGETANQNVDERDHLINGKSKPDSQGSPRDVHEYVGG